MIRFAHPGLLYLLLLVPVFIMAFILLLQWKKQAWKKFGDFRILSRLVPDYSRSRLVIKFIFLLMAMIFLIIGLADPQVGSKLVKAERKGIDIMLALDVSNSMLAEDIQPSRLERSKQSISKLIDELRSDRIGIIVFAGKAYTQLPITTDYSAAKMFLSTISVEAVPVQGTAIGEAIELASNSFDESAQHSKAIIMITDGENHEGDALTIAKEAADKGIHIYTIGMGLPEGAPIPVFQGQNKIGYKKDRQGNTIVTKLNETMLQQIASAGQGVYVRASNASAGLSKIFDEINELNKTEIDSMMFSDYEDRFQYFLAVSLIFLILELMVVERKSKWIRNLNLFHLKQQPE
ncbi:MAG: VWA domain-containing protein [Lentimicrobiaceae bacterium]|nr:VWA domain-containing protein [Lentimicrobiaceae bacterium]